MRTGEVVAKKTGRPLDLVGMHPREELVMMEAMLEHPEKTLTEIVRNYDCIRKPFSSVDGLPILSKKRRYKKTGKQLSAGLL